jgi:hypothetical protein
MYAQEDGSPRRPVRLLLVYFEHRLEDQARAPWLLEELQGELGMDEEALGAANYDLDGLACIWGNSGALVEDHHFS